MRWLLLLLVLLFVPFVSAYYVDVPLNVQISLLYDDGFSTVPIDVQACIISVFSFGVDDLIVRDEPMLNVSGFHEFSFTPNLTGDYGISVQCNYLNDSSNYFEQISVTTPVAGSPSGGGGVLVLNAVVHPEKSSFVVDLGKDSSLSFLVDYQVNGVSVNAGYASFRVLRDDVVLDSGSFIVERTGVYRFDLDFMDYLTGDYKIVLSFDGQSLMVDLKVVSTKGLGVISGFVVNGDGSVNGVGVVLAVFVLLFVVLFLVVIFRYAFGGRKNH